MSVVKVKLFGAAMLSIFGMVACSGKNGSGENATDNGPSVISEADFSAAQADAIKAEAVLLAAGLKFEKADASVPSQIDGKKRSWDWSRGFLNEFTSLHREAKPTDTLPALENFVLVTSEYLQKYSKPFRLRTAGGAIIPMLSEPDSIVEFTAKLELSQDTIQGIHKLINAAAKPKPKPNLEASPAPHELEPAPVPVSTPIPVPIAVSHAPAPAAVPAPVTAPAPVNLRCDDYMKAIMKQRDFNCDVIGDYGGVHVDQHDVSANIDVNLGPSWEEHDRQQNELQYEVTAGSYSLSLFTLNLSPDDRQETKVVENCVGETLKVTTRHLTDGSWGAAEEVVVKANRSDQRSLTFSAVSSRFSLKFTCH